MQRREFLGASLAGVASAATGQDPAPSAPQVPDPARMADLLLQTPRGEVVPLALQWTAAGASPRDLLGAALLAGTREVAPAPIGGQVHAMMMVASAGDMGAWLRGRHAVLPALFNLDRVKNSQARDATERDWTMPPAPPVDARPTSVLAREFTAAMAEWQAPAADRLATALHASLSAGEFFELLWPWAVRDFRVIGHKAIYAAQAHRALQDLGWRHGRDVVRSVLLGVLDENPYGNTPSEKSRQILALFPANQARAAALAAAPEAAADPARSRELAAAMRGLDPEAAATAIAAAAKDGASAPTLWDALRLRAFEQLLRLPNIVGVHPVTSVNALHHIASCTRDAALARLAMLQAASWLSLFEETISARSAADRRDLRIGTIEPAGDGDPFAGTEEAERRGRAARWLADGRFEPFAQRTATVLAQKAREDHDYKFAAAALEEIRRAAPELQPCLAGASMSFLHSEHDADSAVFTQAAPALRG